MFIQSKLSRQNFNTIIYILGDLLNKALPFILLPILLSFISLDDFGRLSLLTSTIDLLFIFILLGGNAYFKVRFFSDNVNANSLRKKLFNQSLIVTVLMIFLTIGYSLLNDLVFNEIFILILLPVCSFLKSIVTIYISGFQCQEQPFSVAKIEVSSTLIVFISTLFLLYIGLGYESRIFGIALAYALVAVFISSRDGFLTFKKAKKDNFSKDAIKFGIGILPNALSWWCRGNLDKFLILYFLTVNEVGEYTIYLQMSLFVIILGNAINNAYQPQIFKLLERSESEIAKKLILKMSVVTVILCSTITLIFPYIITSIISPEHFSNVNIFYLLCLGNMVRCAMVYNSNYYYYYSFTKQLSSISLVGLASHVLLGIVGLYFCGLYGLAISTLITYIFIFILQYIYSSKTIFGSNNG
ncbi:oligosaccharide flippase family protein [Vibrio diabolicus]|uniref:oligosaccharide flippase family protein n=1 Tax=Vibrio diabolicus TaxID=50719 RepID=UPI0037504C9C